MRYLAAHGGPVALANPLLRLLAQMVAPHRPDRLGRAGGGVVVEVEADGPLDAVLLMPPREGQGHVLPARVHAFRALLRRQGYQAGR
jgi:hypothetical protein